MIQRFVQYHFNSLKRSASYVSNRQIEDSSLLRFAAASIFLSASSGAFVYSHVDSIPSASEFQLSLAASGEQLLATSSVADNNANGKLHGRGSRLVFLGTGSSTGCPKPLCSLLFPPQMDTTSPLDKDRLKYQKACEVSALATKGDPRFNKNYRGNPSIVISHYCNESNERKNIIIDVGKTFREHALRWMPDNGITSIDAVVLTHEHMDAMGGLDDLRGFQKVISSLKDAPPKRQSIPIFLSSNCYEAIQRHFPYIAPKNTSPLPTSTPNKIIVKRDVSALEYHTITHFQPFLAAGLQIIPLPVMHGEDFVCNGYAFTVTSKHNQKKNTVLYLSDLSRMLPETMDYIQRRLPPIDIFIVDSLLQHRNHPVHFSLNQAIALSQELKPKQTFIVGMNCDDFSDHDTMNRKISEKYPSIQLAHDGLAIEL